MNRYDLAGKRAIVTGGAGGIGQAVGKMLIASGAMVSLWDASSGVHDLKGHAMLTRQVDVTDHMQVAAAAQADHEALGRIDVLVNNAGILGEIKPLWETNLDDVRRVLDINLLGSLICARAILPLMRAQPPRPHRGHIVNVASANGKEGKANSVAYSASKAGLIGLTKAIAKEVAGDAILVNCITPGAVQTGFSKEVSPERIADSVRRTPLGRILDLEEIARMVAWLCSDDCSFSTGATFDLSGGRTTY